MLRHLRSQPTRRSFIALLGLLCSVAGGAPVASAAGMPATGAGAPYAGLKKRIAVAKFEFGASRKWTDNLLDFGDGMADMLTTELHKTGRFIVVERRELGSVLAEQDLGASGRVSQATAAKVGELLGAQYLVVGVITEFEERASNTGGGLSGPLGNVGILLGGNKSSAHIGVDIRLIDSTTGAIIVAKEARGRAQGSALGGGLSYKGWQAGLGHQEQTAIGIALRSIMAQLVTFVVTNMEAVPWQAKVAAVQGDAIYINAGANMNVAAGAEFEIAGQPVRDPETGKVIAFGEPSGRIRAEKVLPEATICKLLDGAMPERGDVVQPVVEVVAAPPVSPAVLAPDPGTTAPVAGARFCPQCGTKLPEGARFCPKCGRKAQ